MFVENFTVTSTVHLASMIPRAVTESLPEDNQHHRVRCIRICVACKKGEALRDRADPAGEDALAIEFILCGLEQVAPRGDIRTTAEQCAALALSHAAPHAELDAVVEGIGQAVGAHDATGANGLGPVLGGSLDEQGVRV